MYGQPNNYYFQPQQPLRGIEYLQNQYQQQIPQQGGLKGRPVSSVEEVRAAQIDFDGSLFIFPDIANKCIYTKQISATGAAILNKYTLQTETQSDMPTYITRDEFDTIINQLKLAIESKDAVISELVANQQKIVSQPTAVTQQKETINF